MDRTMNTREKVGLAVIIVLVVATIVLSVYLGIYVHDHGKYKNNIENVYRHAYYTLSDNYMNIATALGKVRVTYGATMLEETLEQVTDNARLAVSQLSTLSTSENDLTHIFRFTNQVGDYARYVTTRVQKGETMTSSERDVLTKMHAMSEKLCDALADIEDSVNREGFAFVDTLGKEQDAFSNVMVELGEGSIKYPALIYDGPFSDGITDRDPLGLGGDAVTKEQCMARVRDLFPEVRDVQYTGESSGKIASYMYDVTISDGHAGTISMSKIGGHIVMFTSYISEGDVRVEEKDAIAYASEFLARAGYRDMHNVYVSLSHGMYYLNYCPKVDGVLYYPDLIKVKVSAEDGAVTGMELLNYLYNHRPRTVDKAGILDETRVIAHINSDMDIESVALALIPRAGAKETLTYEIIGTLDEARYYIYLDPISGDEVNVLMEIRGADGELLI